jgi:lipoprotein signal peptidase
VTDFINIQIIPVFNVADMLLNIGVLLIIVHYFCYGRHRR